MARPERRQQPFSDPNIESDRFGWGLWPQRQISEAFENAGKYGHSAMLYEMFDHTGTAGDRPAAYDSAPPWQVRRRESSPHKLAAISEEQR
jgi:hypothetical protein